MNPSNIKRAKALSLASLVILLTAYSMSERSKRLDNALTNVEKYFLASLLIDTNTSSESRIRWDNCEEGKPKISLEGHQIIPNNIPIRILINTNPQAPCEANLALSTDLLVRTVRKPTKHDMFDSGSTAFPEPIVQDYEIYSPYTPERKYEVKIADGQLTGEKGEKPRIGPFWGMIDASTNTFLRVNDLKIKATNIAFPWVGAGLDAEHSYFRLQTLASSDNTRVPIIDFEVPASKASILIAFISLYLSIAFIHLLLLLRWGDWTTLDEPWLAVMIRDSTNKLENCFLYCIGFIGISVFALSIILPPASIYLVNEFIDYPVLGYLLLPISLLLSIFSLIILGILIKKGRFTFPPVSRLLMNVNEKKF